MSRPQAATVSGRAASARAADRLRARCSRLLVRAKLVMRAAIGSLRNRFSVAENTVRTEEVGVTGVPEGGVIARRPCATRARIAGSASSRAACQGWLGITTRPAIVSRDSPDRRASAAPIRASASGSRHRVAARAGSATSQRRRNEAARSGA